MLEASISAAERLFSPGPLLVMLIMLPISLISGMMPGGNLPIAVIVLGFAGYLDPWITVTAVVFFLAASDITEPVPSILMGIPGARSAQATEPIRLPSAGLTTGRVRPDAPGPQAPLM